MVDGFMHPTQKLNHHEVKKMIDVLPKPKFSIGEKVEYRYSDLDFGIDEICKGHITGIAYKPYPVFSNFSDSETWFYQVSVTETNSLLDGTNEKINFHDEIQVFFKSENELMVQ
jgi:hypothetical protein